MPIVAVGRAAPERRQLLAKIHIARKAMALEEDSYRALLARITGRDSAADIGNADLVRVVEEFKRLGWKDAPAKARRAGHRQLAPGAEAAKARALWLNLYHLGVIADPAEAKLDAFARRMTGKDSLRFLDQAGMDRLIKALRGWLERVGYKEPDALILAGINTDRGTMGLPEIDHAAACKMEVIRRGWQRLVEIGAMRHGIHARIDTFLNRPHLHLVPPADLDRHVERIGAWLRAELRKKADELPPIPAPGIESGEDA